MGENNPECSQYENSSFSCPNDSSFGIRLGMYTFLILCMTVTIFGNLGLIISILFFKQLYSPTNFLILSMAGADFLLGFLIMPYSMVRSVERCWYFGNIFCKVHYSFDLMLIIRNMIFLCWAAPAVFAFGVVITNSHVSGITDYELLVACFHFCPITFNKLWSVIMFFTCFLAPGSVMVGIYIRIFIVSQRHVRILKGIPNHSQHETITQLSKKKDIKAAKTLGIVMGVFLSCWLPVFIAIVINPFTNFSTPDVLFDALNWLGYINSTCNPLIYGFFYPWFRKSLKYIILGKICDPSSGSANLLESI
ncbi:hypothetical protein GDO86_009650 [Hymenochirus boettgeri]|uniref:G-protein coupled receptors family 1 profile domain-containing protein n=1 Tax=Hymenochirus boettgeri TaxID=247094 RepID=A0A8T2JQ58_9PIPI|nr:hypothetical protein GDO86_009650 [Hymenochirus boettgeri]